MNIRLIYFDMPFWRAEASRIALFLGGIPFDEVLRQLAHTLKDSVRTDHFTARLGGDEFLIICPDTDLNGALIIAEKMRCVVDAMRVPTGNDGVWKGSISVGVACRAEAMKGPDDLIKAADNGVYLAKEAGRNCVRHTDIM